MNWDDQLTRIRRQLRDPDGNIWSDALLLRLYNDSQRNLQTAVGQLEDVQNIRVPSPFQQSYLYDWEWRHSENDIGYVYQALNFFDQGDTVYASNWESEQLVPGQNVNTTDDATYYTQPWEAYMPGVTPGNAPPVWIDSSFDKLVSIYFNKDPLEAITKKQLTRDDSTWKTRSGKPFAYYREDELGNRFIIYPTPNTVSWGDIEIGSAPLGFSYVHDWELSDGYFGTTGGNNLTLTDDDNAWEVTYRWEIRPYDPTVYFDADSDTWVDSVPEEGFGVALYDDEGGGDFGLVIDQGFVAGLVGAGTDLIDPENNLTAIFHKIPSDLVEWDDESDYPTYFRKYIEYGVLEEAYAASTAGKIQSLEDYWGWRKDLAYRALKLFGHKKKADRDYRMQTQNIYPRSTRRRPRLPDAYPAAYP